MFARAATGTVIGIEAHPVVVEASGTKGLPGIALIGLARGAARESVVRVRSAIRACGLSLPKRAVVINLKPAELPKDGSSLDLALALAWLASAGLIEESALCGRRFYGELALGGNLEPVYGAALIADLARVSGENAVLVPAANAAEAAIIPAIKVFGFEHLGDVIAFLKGEKRFSPQTQTKPSFSSNPDRCLSEVRGQTRAKRALEIAAAGNHNLLLIGPPGSGKTMLAKRLPSILPPLNLDESIELSRIHSAAGTFSTAGGLCFTRPFRAPHHTVSEAALCGGGSLPKPGEITLAHNGVLFLDEFPEFSRRALESLREPLEEGFIHVARAALAVRFPARVLLVAAMNPCPCGLYKGDNPSAGTTSPNSNRPICLCSCEQIRRYRARISGPLLDRIDLHVTVDNVSFKDYSAGAASETSSTIKERVLKARAMQAKRLGDNRTNSGLNEDEIRLEVCLDPKILKVIEQAIDVRGLSTRAVTRLLKVARTIADLNADEKVQAQHVAEALSFRLINDDSPNFSLPD